MQKFVDHPKSPLMKNLDLKKVLNQLKTKADWVGLREVRETMTQVVVRDGHPEKNSTDTSQGLFVEVLVGGQFGYCATNQLSGEAIQRAADKAHLYAKTAAPFAVYKFDESARPCAVGSYESPFKKNFDTFAFKEANDFLLKVYETLKRPDKIISAKADLALNETEFHYVSSNGSDTTQKFLLISSDFQATARQDHVLQTRTDHGFRGHCFQMGLEYLNESEILARARLISEQAVELLSAEECPSETMDLVLMPDQMMLQIHESIGHPLELDRILGDEKNFAGSSFVRKKDFGHLQYGSPLLNVTFDPTVSGEFASYAFDDGGLKATREFLIKDGILVRPLGGLESQIRSGLPGTANFRAMSWNRAPIDRMGNINLEPGECRYGDIIASVERGVLMESNRSWSIDDYRRKFQFGCEYGKLIKNGKITKTVRNPNYRGVTVPFWKNLKKVGNQSTWQKFGSPYCGKGEPNQLIRVGHASPVCLFSGVEVFGGAA